MNSRFPQFSALPKELRLEIWRCTLPRPQILDLCIEKTPDGKRCWKAKDMSRTLFPGILLVNHEARQVALESYEQMNNTWTAERGLWQRCYIDFEKDILIFSHREFSQFFNPGLLDGDLEGLELPVDPSKARSIAVSSCNYRHEWPELVPSDLSHVYRDSSLNVYSDVLNQFRHLREFLFVIDGTFYAFDGPDELVEPSPEDEDYYRQNGRITYISWIPRFVEALKDFNPGIHVPDIRVKLRINGRVPVKDYEHFERRWKYNHAHCYVVSQNHEGDFSEVEDEYDGPCCAYDCS